MKIRTLLASAAAAVTLTVGIPTAASAAPGPTIADLLDAQGNGPDRNWYDFDLLAAGVDAAGLSGALDDPSADLTVFIPNDLAFRNLVVDLYGPSFRTASEAQVLGKLVELETGAPGTLATVILYHAVPGQIDSSTALSVRWNTQIPTLQGEPIAVRPLRFAGTAQLGDRDFDDTDAFLLGPWLDIQASNGIAHGINEVLRPVNL
jgi:uncharacterized surface protein with fasciclin (FAS1) repeats